MRLALTTLALLLSTMLFAQAPALIPYQAIARNAAAPPGRARPTDASPPMDAERLNQTQSLIDDLRARLGELRRYL